MAKSTLRLSGAIEVGSLASAPSNPKKGTIYVDTGLDQVLIYDGSSFQEVTDQSQLDDIIGDLSFGPSNYTPTDATEVAGHLEGIDTALGSIPSAANVILRDGSNDFTANQSMASNKLTNVADGTDAGDAVNRGQLDLKANDSEVIKSDGSVAFTGNQSMGTNKLTDVVDGTDPQDAVTKSQLDVKADTADVILRDGTNAFSANQDMGNNRLTGLAAPVNPDDAARKQDVDDASAGIISKEACRMATTGNITLSGIQTIDTVIGISGDRVLVKDQTDATENGIYDMAAGAWARSSDFDGTPASEVQGGALVYVTEGSDNINTSFRLTGTGELTPGVDNLIWIIYSRAESIQAGDGLNKSGLVLSVDSSNIAGAGLEDDGSNNLRLAASSAGNGIQLNAGVYALDFSEFSSDDITEGSTNFFYTETRFDASLATKDTDDLAEGATNLYFTQTAFDSSFSGKDTDDLSEGSTNFYYTETRFDTSLSGKSTTDVSEGSNLYFTDARARTAAVLNTTAGNETDQAASVAALKSFVSGQGFLSEVVEDLTPELGGDLEVGANAIEAASNEIVIAGQNSVRRAKQASKSNFVEEEYVHSTSLSASQTDSATGLQFATATFQAQEISYIVEDSLGARRMGTIRLVNDGSNVNISDTGTELGDASEITFDADINAGNVRLLYSTGVQSATLRCDIKKYLA